VERWSCYAGGRKKLSVFKLAPIKRNTHNDCGNKKSQKWNIYWTVRHEGHYFCSPNKLKKLNFNERFLKLTYKFNLKTQAYKMGHKFPYFETFCLWTCPHSKLQVCMTCSGSNHLITTQLNHYHVPHNIAYVAVFFLARTTLSLTRMFMPCWTTADLFRMDESVVLALMQNPFYPM